LNWQALAVPHSQDADVALIETQLRAVGSPQRAASAQNYLKSPLEFCGATVPQIRSVVTAWRRASPDLSVQRLTQVAAALWERELFECRLAAVILLADQRKLLGPDDAWLIERMLRCSRTWALVDSLAADVMGWLVERYPVLLATLDSWAADDDFWMRRSAMLALLVPLRQGNPAGFERFAGYADAMLDEREFFIRKAIGWVLRETGKKQPGLVTQWLAPRADRASGVTMREAVKWLPEADRETLLAAYALSTRSRPSQKNATGSADRAVTRKKGAP
jgi:3-methyladenine DNA glycosylase AlkD